MYNRYVPQPDGSFHKNRVQDKQHQSGNPKPHPKSEPSILAPPEKPKPEQSHRPHPESNSIGGFLKNLLPKDMDTGDLIVVLLLLLMAGDCSEDKNTALLTLALYFFM